MIRQCGGTGTEVVCPLDEKACKELQTVHPQDVLSQLYIYTSLHSEAVSKEAFSIADGQVMR